MPEKKTNSSYVGNDHADFLPLDIPFNQGAKQLIPTPDRKQLYAAEVEHESFVTLKGWEAVRDINPTVTKSNLLIRSFSMFTKNEQKVLAAAICAINPWTPISSMKEKLATETGTTVDSHQISFRVVMTSNDICRLTGIDSSNFHKFIDQATQSFLTKPIQIVRNTKKGEQVTKFNITTSCTFDQNTLLLTFHPYLSKDLADLSGEFTSYRLNYYAHLPTKYSLQLYELFASMSFRQGGTIYLFDPKELQASLYFILGLIALDHTGGIKTTNSLARNYSTFRKRILLPALEAINEKTNLCVKIEEEIKRGRSIFAVRFSVEDSNSTKDTVNIGVRLGANREVVQHLITKYGQEIFKANAALMDSVQKSGTIILKPDAYLTRIVRNDYASLPEKLNPLGEENVIDANLRSFLESFAIKLYRSAPDHLADDMEEYGVESLYLAPHYRNYLIYRSTSEHREAIALLNLEECIKNINKI